MERLREAIRQAVELAPGSIRALAIEAGIDQSLLSRILSGEKGITPETAAKIEAALVAWRDRCNEGAMLIRRANPQRRSR